MTPWKRKKRGGQTKGEKATVSKKALRSRSVNRFPSNF